MLKFQGLTFNDDALRPYSFSKRLVQNYYQNECEIFITYGMPEGIGKSAYVSHTLADVFGFQNCHDKELLKPMYEPKLSLDAPVWPSDWNKAKDFTLYLPEDVVERCKWMLEHDVRDIAFHFDDGGTWLNAMEWSDPFVIAFMEYGSLARSNWGGVVISTPVEEWVLKKLRTASGVLRIPIIKLGSNQKNPFRPRRATCYKIVRFPNRVRPYWQKQFVDDYVAIMDKEFYDWYGPNRRKYALMAALKMEKALEKRKKRGAKVEVEEEVIAERKEHIAKANDLSVDLQELVAQKTEEAHSL